VTEPESDDRRWLREQLDELFEHSAESLAQLTIDESPGWRIRAEVGINDAPHFELTGSGATAREAFTDFVGRAASRLDQASELMRRGNATCWVCSSQRPRVDMESEVIGGEIWWLCDRCQRRRSNAARLKLIWPTDYETWLRRWRAEQRTAGRSGEWMTNVEAEALARHDRDPFIVNRMTAVLAVAAES